MTVIGPFTTVMFSYAFPANLWSHRAPRMPAIEPCCASVSNICTTTWKCGGILSSAMSPDSTYHNWIIGSKCREDTEHAVLIAAPISLQLLVKTVWLCGTASIKMQFCNQWQSHIFTVWEWTQHLGMACSPNCNPIENFGISLGELFLPEWTTQPHWLTYNKCLLKNGVPFHSSVWPSWWGGGARLLWMCIVLPDVSEAPLFINWVSG